MTFLLNKNNQEIRNTLKDKYKLTICACSEFKDSCWLAFYPYLQIPFHIHGVGYVDEFGTACRIILDNGPEAQGIEDEASLLTMLLSKS